MIRSIFAAVTTFEPENNAIHVKLKLHSFIEDP